MAALKIGFLPLYLEFYREAVPQCSAPAAAFAETIAAGFRGRGIEVAAAPVCCLRADAAAAVAAFERQKVDAIVTLHLAYSPSLETAAELAGTELPLILLDTTPDAAYRADHSTLMANHGIHGVQDLANVLRRRGKPFRIVAGFHRDERFFDDALLEIMAAHSARTLRSTRVGRIGKPFDGMGDFLVEAAVLKEKLGVTVIDYAPPAPPVAPDEAAIRAYCREVFGDAAIDPAAARACAEAGLAVRAFAAQNRLNAFTFNFQELAGLGFPGVPFLEASHGMARGVGYAGEGDALTAAFVAALLAARPAATFTEMFCPDWTRNLVYLSHMGEVNPALLDQIEFAADPNPFVALPTPVIACGALRAGRCALVNLAPAPDDEFELIVLPGAMVAAETPEKHRVSGYFRSDLILGDALKAYSEHGGTHHLAAVYDTPVAFFAAFAAVMGFKLTVIQP